MSLITSYGEIYEPPKDKVDRIADEIENLSEKERAELFGILINRKIV